MHTPAYASIVGSSGGMVVDASDYGICVQSVNPVAARSFVNVRLDLLETRSSIAAPAHVAWSDRHGRSGIEFLHLTSEARRQLQQWLMLNALAAAEAARFGPPQSVPQPVAEPVAALDQNDEPLFAIAEAGQLYAAVQQALDMTHAHGAALALGNATAMVCSAAVGDVAPPVSSPVNTRSGISGACIRAASVLRCGDPECDPHVDRDSCRALGVSSVVVVPLVAGSEVRGILEVFSRHLHAFNDQDCAGLQEIARSVSKRLFGPPSAAPASRIVAAAPLANVAPVSSTVPQASMAAAAPAVAPQVAPPVVPAPGGGEASSPSPVAPSSAPLSSLQHPSTGVLRDPSRRLLIFIAVGIVTIVSVGWAALSLPLTSMLAGQAAHARPVSATADAAPVRALTPVAKTSTPTEVNSLDHIRELAERGDADSQFELGAKYASGDEVAQDYSEAVSWFTRAAEHGHVLAAATLGAFYWAGRGVPQDYVAAYTWSAIAKNAGDEASKYRVAILRARMTSAQVAVAEEHASAWLQIHPLHQAN